MRRNPQQLTRMIIRTTQEQNAANCCGCDVPECADPRQLCESSSVSVSAAGFFDLGDTEWIIYRTHRLWWELNDSFSNTYTTYSAVAHEYFFTTYPRNFQGSVTGNGEECEAWPAVPVFSCDTAGTSSLTYKSDGVNTDYTNTLNRTKTGDGALGDGCTWEDENVYTDYDFDPPEVTTTTIYNTAITTAYYSYDPASFTSGEDYDDAATYAEWVASTVAEIDSGIEFQAECLGSLCVSSMSVTPDPEETDVSVSMSVTKARFKFGVPTGYTGSVWQQTWDYVQAPADWWSWFDDSMTGAEPTPGPSLVSSDSWTWGGSMATEADQFSDWKNIPIPTVPGECRAVNMLVTCYASTRLGVKPTAVGDQIAIPE